MICQHCGREHPQGTPKCPETGEPTTAPGLIGTKVDRYQVERLLGVGGFGSVYRARHVHTDALVALKLLKRSMGADQSMIDRFLREAKAAAAIGNPHIVGVLDAGISADGQPFLALEYLDGMDLKELAYREAPLNPVRLVLLTIQVLDALSAAHARGIVHRDMKPANVFVVRRQDERGVERDFVKLLDFGISKMHADGDLRGLTMTGVAMGTPAYMAPEQFFDARNVDGRADVYSVAVMVYELLSGKLPFDADSYAALIVKVQNEEPRLLQAVSPAVPSALAQTVMVGLAKDAMKRWQTARDFANALRTAIDLPLPGQTPAQVTPGTPIPLGQSVRVAPAAPSPLAQFTPGPSVATPRPAVAPLPPTPAPLAAPAGPPTAPKKSNTTLWVLAIIGIILTAGGCCTCGGLAWLNQAVQQQQLEQQGR